MNESPISRRAFLKTTAFATAGWTGGSGAKASPLVRSGPGVRAAKDIAAIAMWDFSWALRHDRGCEFADWAGALDGLVLRGYDTIRLDVFPPLVASATDGGTNDSWAFPKNNWKPAIWGNQFTTTLHPRESLRQFIPLCLDRGLRLALSTWFSGADSLNITGLDGLVRVWDETLRFLRDHDLLHNIYYVDLLNEYPLFNGFSRSWMRRQMAGKVRAPAAGEPVQQWEKDGPDYNRPEARSFYVDFADKAIGRMQARWPGLDFLFSVTNVAAADWRIMAPTRIAAMDVHDWFVIDPLLSRDSGYFEHVHRLGDNDREFPRVQTALARNWAARKPELIERMDARMAEAAELGRRHDKPVGNTEGWGIINWMDHPALTWDIVREAGLICAGLARQHGYRFICTSNFTHPQFPGLWADVAWHQRATGIIRGG